MANNRLFKAFQKDRNNVLLKNGIKRSNDIDKYKNNQEFMSMMFGDTIPDNDTIESSIQNFNSINSSSVGTSPKTSMGFTSGDIVGTIGSAIGAVSQMANTIQNAKATKPVVNHFEGFNEKALANNNLIKDEIGYRESEAKAELERTLRGNENTLRSRTRNSASGINTMRALDLGVDTNITEAKTRGISEINNNFSQQLMQILGIDTQLLSQKDQMEMSGRTAADEANAANLDNFYSNFAQNISGVSTSIQKLGADINKNKYNNDVLKLIPGSNKWGVGVDANMDVFSTYSKNDKYAPVAQGITEQQIPNFNYLSEILNT